MNKAKFRIKYCPDFQKKLKAPKELEKLGPDQVLVLAAENGRKQEKEEKENN